MLILLKSERIDLDDNGKYWRHYYWYVPSNNYMSPGIHERISEGKSNNDNVLGQLFKAFYYLKRKESLAL